MPTENMEMSDVSSCWGEVVRFNSTPTHHYFVCTPDLSQSMTDDEGRVMVFTSRPAAALAALGWQDVIVIIGMGDVRWEAFQEVPHVVIEAVEACPDFYYQL